jgi:predicted dehydrogenase
VTAPRESRHRVAIVGCGPRGGTHARAYAALPDCELVACCDLDQSRLRDFADRHAVPGTFTSVASMLDRIRPDLVDVTTQPDARRPIVEAALPFRPRAIVLEKPPAARPEDADAIFGAAAEAGVPVYVNHQLRFFEPIRRFRDLLAAEPLGEVRHVRATTRATLLEHGTHLFDLVAFFFGDRPGFVAVLARGVGRDPSPGGWPRFAAGVLATEAGWRLYFELGPEGPVWPGTSSPWHQLGIEIVGTAGVAGLSLNRGWWIRSAAANEDATWAHDDEDEPAQRRFLDGVLHVIERGTGHEGDARRGRAAFDTVVAVRDAARNKGWVAVLEGAEREPPALATTA